MDQRTYADLCAEPEALALLKATFDLRAAIAADPLRDQKIAALAGFFDQHVATLRTRIEAAAAFERELPARIDLILAPNFDAGLHDLAGIKQVAEILVSASGQRTLADAAKAFKAVESWTSGERESSARHNPRPTQ
jgi:hypothetical protein